MRAKLFTFILYLFFVAGGFHPIAGQQPAGDLPQVDRSAFTARGKNETILHIAQAGRYSLQAKSGQGTRIELVDRMAGLIGEAGVAGESDGRLDIVLDRGDYKVRLLSHKKGSGEVSLKVMTFQEANPVADPADHPMLKELEPVRTGLNDLEQRSYWIELKQRRVLNLEVMGRALAECRLWKYGVLWEDVKPTVTVYEPEAGKPMTHVEFHHDLNAGIYLLSCYGGPLQKWSEDKGETPLHLRWGIPRIGENGQRMLTLSPFGRDVFLAGKETNFFQLVRTEKKPTQLQVRRWEEKSSRFGAGYSASISKESRDPWCMVRTGSGYDMVIVTAAPGDMLELDYFKQVYWYEIKNLNAHYWLSSIHSVEGRDALDVTGILFNYLQKTAVREQVVQVGPKKPLVRRVNLLDPDNIFLFIEEPGTYVIDEEKSAGASAEYQITPLMIFRPGDYRAPPFQAAGYEWVLTRGYHVLSMQPKSRGILHFAMQQKEDFLSSPLKALFSSASSPLQEKPGAAALGFFWPDVLFELHTSYMLYINQRSRVESGIIFRQLPLNLEDPLTVTLGPGQSAPVRARVEKISTIEVIGGETQLLVNGAATTNRSTLQPGDYSLELKNVDKASRVFNLLTVPVPPPPAKPVVKKIESMLPILEEGKPLFANYSRGQNREYLVRVKEPAIYRLETTGLLATSIRVRSFLVTSLFEDRENGIGRNALVQQYLKPGDYIVAVQVLGQTRGRAGLQLRRTPVESSTDLSLGSVSRKKVAADSALVYRFNIPKPGKYHLETLGLGKTFSYRLEENGGWPLILNEKNESIEQEFDPGSYSYYSLPEPVESRRVTYLKPISEETPIRGKGPHSMECNRPVENIWMETSDRKPDTYTVAVAAPIQARLTVERDLEAVLIASKDKEIARTQNGEWKGDLEAGSYRILVRSIEKTNRLPYMLKLSTEDFIPGMTRSISSPTEVLEVSLGETGLVEISSFGRQDCRALLREKSSGIKVAESDDMPDDWNFLISKELKAGRYQLLVESMTPANTPYEVRMSMRTSRTLAESTVPFTVSEKPGKDILKVPFKTGAAEELLHLFWQKSTGMQMALLKDNVPITEGQSEIYIPLPANSRYILMLWQEGAQSGEVKLKAEPVPAPRLNVDRDISIDNFRAGRVENPGGYGMQAAAAGRVLLFSPLPEKPCIPRGEAGEPALISPGWLAVAKECRMQLSPMQFKTEKEESLTLGDMPFSFAIESGSAPMLLECESTDAMVGVRISPSSTAARGPFPWPGIVMQKGLTLAGIPDSGSFRGEIRRLTAEIPGEKANRASILPERVTLRLRTFVLQETRNFTDAAGRDFDLKAGHAVRLAIQSEQESITLVLPQNTAAFSWSKDQPVSMTAAVSENCEENLLARKGFVYIINRGDESAPVSIRRAPAQAGTDHILDLQEGWERVFSAPGQTRITIPDIPVNQFLCVAGEDVSSYFLTDDGRLLAGKKMECLAPVNGYPSGRGLLVMNHGYGFVRAWVASEKQIEKTFMGNLNRAEEGKWSGDIGILKNGLQKWSVAVTESSVLDVVPSCAGALALFQDEKPEAIYASINPVENHFFILVEKGRYTLYSRPLAGHFQEGMLTLKKSRPLNLKPPGPEKELLIAAGEIQSFRFQVKVKGNVGIGLKAENENLDAWLFNSRTAMLGRGPLIVRELEPGEYTLVVWAGDAPQRYRPVILGSEGSLQNIPEEVIREYLKKEEQP